MYARILVCMAAGLLLLPVSVSAWPARLLRVLDGDTLAVSGEYDRRATIRLYGVDCPENGQAYAREASQAAKAMTEGQSLDIDEYYPDRFGRSVSTVRLPDGGTMQDALLRQGLAWVAPRYCKRPECAAWVELERAARAARLGLWRDEAPLPPWQWRAKAKTVGPMS